MSKANYKTSVKVVVGKNVAEFESNLESALNDGYYINSSGGTGITVLPEHHAFGGSTSLAILVTKTEPVENEKPVDVRESTTPVTPTPETAPVSAPTTSSTPTPVAPTPESPAATPNPAPVVPDASAPAAEGTTSAPEQS